QMSFSVVSVLTRLPAILNIIAYCIKMFHYKIDKSCRILLQTRQLFVFLSLFSQTKFLDQSTISLDIFLSQVSKKTSSLSYHLQKTSSGVMILWICLEMICQIVDSSCQDRNLNLR